MPSRYFPFAQDFNSDPEGWEFTELFGDRILRVWMQLLSISDRNQSPIIKGTVDQWGSTLARTIFSKGNPRWIKRDAETVKKALLWMDDKGWMGVLQNGFRDASEASQRRVRRLSESDQRAIRELSEPCLVVFNYAKYHKTRSGISQPPNPPNPPNPDHHKNDEEKSAPPQPSAGPPNSGNGRADSDPESVKAKPKTLDPQIKEVADRIYNSDPQKFSRLIVWIKQAEQQRFVPEVIVSSLTRFEPYAHSVANWYPYLDKLIYKTDRDFNRDAHDAAHEARKEEMRDLSKSPILEIVKGLSHAKKF